MPDPKAAFKPRSFDDRLADNPEADAYVTQLARLVAERGENPSWTTVRAHLAEYGVEVTTNPIKRVVEQRAHAVS